MATTSNAASQCEARPGAIAQSVLIGLLQATCMRRCAGLKWGLPFRRKRALHLTGQRLAGCVEIYGSRY